LQVISNKEELQAQLVEWRHEGEHIAVVPTMGNLHVGHISLVELAREHAERVVVTLFVNPTQFGDGEDFEDYPRTIERDTRRLRRIGADILYMPDVATVYPFGIDNATIVSVPGLTANFCGKHRPGHFDGVTTVVMRLLAIVQPEVAVFGQKDFQQHLVVRRMTEDLNIPVNVICSPTVREDDGLAMSSRNAYLTDDERAIAPGLYRTLESMGFELEDGKRNYAELEAKAIASLQDAGFDPEYVAVRRAVDLSEPDRDHDELVVLAAARLGKARLIDNIVVTI
jgi:pantoate--beta-alanine ligase